MVKQGNNAIVQLRIRWSSSSTSSTWEDYGTLRRRFPSATMQEHDAAKQEDPAASVEPAAPEEEASSEEEGSVTPASL